MLWRKTLLRWFCFTENSRCGGILWELRYQVLFSLQTSNSMRTSLSRKCCPPAARAGEMLWQHRGLQGTFPKEQEVPRPGKAVSETWDIICDQSGK